MRYCYETSFNVKSAAHMFYNYSSRTRFLSDFVFFQETMTGMASINCGKLEYHRPNNFGGVVVFRVTKRSLTQLNYSQISLCFEMQDSGKNN